MDVGRAFTYMFRDPNWMRKLGLAALLSLPAAVLWLLNATLHDRFLPGTLLATPLVNAVISLASVPLLGFGLRITRQVVAGSDLPLPAWSDVRGIARDGLKLWAVSTVWELPTAVIRIVEDTLSPGPGDDGPLALRGPTLVVMLVVLVLQPAAEARLATTGSVAAGLDIGAAFRVVGRNLRGYLVLLLIVGIGGTVGFGLSAGLVWLAWNAVGGQPGIRDVLNIGIALVIFFPYVRFVLAHLYGQAYSRADRGPTPSPRAPARRKGEPSAGPARRPPARRSETRIRGRSADRPVPPSGMGDGRPN